MGTSFNLRVWLSVRYLEYASTLKVLITVPKNNSRNDVAIMYDEKVNLYILLWKKMPTGAYIRAAL